MKRFSLIELLVVIAILAILAGMLVPAIKKAREQGRSSNRDTSSKEVENTMSSSTCIGTIVKLSNFDNCSTGTILVGNDSMLFKCDKTMEERLQYYLEKNTKVVVVYEQMNLDCIRIKEIKI